MVFLKNINGSETRSMDRVFLHVCIWLTEETRWEKVELLLFLLNWKLNTELFYNGSVFWAKCYILISKVVFSEICSIHVLPQIEHKLYKQISQGGILPLPFTRFVLSCWSLQRNSLWTLPQITQHKSNPLTSSS